ncbi:integrator complex subunit 2-like [Saccostrea cucullata]|uniref:integrator complex subunit 2-like n=1 Tax=Saccostrea cuccullata TaxID=36930 RepID=UPI002ED2DA1C
MREFVESRVFQAMQNVDVSTLNKLREKDLRPVLPCLVRMALCKPLDESESWATAKKDVLKILSGIEVVNSIVALLSIDFHALEQDVNKEQQLRTKLGGNQTESILISQLQNGVALEFERSDPPRRLRLLLSELLFVASQVRESKTEFYQKSSELFESLVYLEEVSDVLCIAQAELPALLPITEVSETLLHVPNGDWMLCRLVANSPDCYKEVCTSLVTNGDRQDEETVGGQRRMAVLLALARMNPKEMYNIRALCVENCKMPGLAMALTLEMNKDKPPSEISGDSNTDVVGFVSGMLLGNNTNVKDWFSQYVKIGQKLKRDASVTQLQSLRLCLLEQMISILPDGGGTISESQAIKASAFIRLYCALKSMAAFKFTDEEMKILLRLITSRPPLSKAGARFVSLGLCMLIACPYLLGSNDQEKVAIDWIKWSLLMEKEFKLEVSSACSFGEMLFLIAIHFHSNNMTAISDLVYLTLGLKNLVKANALARIRQIFIYEIFTEQVITSHAVKVPVTPGLNANMTGYLPINSIYQLLKSRSFSKHKVPIKDWIYQQICNCSTPLHPLVTSLIDVYVTSTVIKSTKTDHLNEPITEEEILNVYKSSVFHWSKSEGEESSNSNSKSELAPQLLILYYLLHYEDIVLTHMKTLVMSNRKVKSYHDTLLAQIPINFLLQTAQREQEQYAGLFSPLLKLLVTHYPHLCVVEDWLEEKLIRESLVAETSVMYNMPCTIDNFNDALRNLTTCPMKMISQLQAMLKMSAPDLLQFAEPVVSSLPIMLDEVVPRKIVDLIKKVWFLLHGVSPRSLRLSTVNSLRLSERTTFQVTPYTENDITVDPLIILRCDERVFRCPPILDILLRVLSAYLQASRVYLHNHMLSNPIMENAAQVERERLDLKNALIAAQESAIIQILLESCLPTQEEQREGQESLLNNCREIQCIICSFIHQLFITEPHLAKLVHFQGYPDTLLPVTTTGIPSIHICLDYIPEILSQPQAEKQIFAIKLMSHLCCQYALPRSLSVAKLCINVMFTMIGVLENTERVNFFLETVPCLTKVCQAFPPLCEDVTSFLHQIGRVCMSHLTAASNLLESELSDLDRSYVPLKKKLKIDTPKQELAIKYRTLYRVVQQTFARVIVKSLVTKNIYA